MVECVRSHLSGSSLLINIYSRIGSGARNVKALSKEPLEDGDDSDQENDIADIKAQRKARRGIAPQHKAGGSGM
jgi:hypothetical protein